MTIAGGPERASVGYRLRFDECGADGSIRAGTVLRYAQDVAWIHSERLGYDRAWYADRGLMWLVRGIDLTLERPAVSGTSLVATTRLTGFRRIWARREALLETEAGERVATILTDWVMADASGAPTRIPAEFSERFSEPLPPFEPTAVELPAAPPDATSLALSVRAADLDPFGHANNAAWLDWVDEALAEASARGTEGLPLAPEARRYRLVYLAAAGPRERLVARVWPDPDGSAGCTIERVGADGVASPGLRARVETVR